LTNIVDCLIIFHKEERKNREITDEYFILFDPKE